MLFKIMMQENERLRRETYFLRTDLFNSQGIHNQGKQFIH